jgi:stearoyl-CoA desaturase (delta-9 desaturase)
VLSYAVRCFAIGGIYHRYFSHQSYKTSRWFQFVLAVLGCTTGQRGPLSWATSHRLHHQHADRDGDPHSPTLRGFWHAHMGWYLEKDALPTHDTELKRFEKTPEIIWLNRNHSVVFLVYLAALYALGVLAGRVFETSGATGLQFVLWGGFVSTLLLIHATGLINSVSHLFGERDYETPDGSRNVSWLFILTFGENWHNTHHRYPWSANAGIKPGHKDWIFKVLKGLERLGLIHDLKNAKADKPEN